MAKNNKPSITTQAPTKQMWKRSIQVLIVIVFVFFSVISGKLVVLQVVQTEDWQKAAMSQQLSDSIISPNRGTIYDSNMKVLAQSYGVYTVIMTPKNIPSEEMRTKLADDLSKMLDIDREKLYTKAGKKTSQYEIVKAKIELEDANKVSEWAVKNKMTGVLRTIQDYKRTYPMNSLLSDVLGFTGTDNYGLYGLEAQYNDELSGTPGRILTAKNGKGDELPTSMKYEKTVDGQDGNSLVLTVDATIQSYAEKYLDIAVKENACRNRGICIVMDVKTGGVLAMATKGDFDPNHPMEVADGTTEATIAKLAGDEQSNALKAAREKQWQNKPISDYYEPGSVFKIFTASMGLEEGVVNMKTTFNCPGYEIVGGRKIRCWVYPRSHGIQTLPEALSHSCNPAFMQLGAKVGPTLFYKYYAGFGFTDKTNIDMLSEFKVTPSLYHTEKQLNPVELATSSIGQTFKVTPIQMAAGVCAIANGGKLMQPYVVQQVLDSSGNVIKNHTPVVTRQVISETTSRQVVSMMAGAVNGGGARNGYVMGYRVAGKTGTSEKTEINAVGGSKQVWASFTGIAPADDPQVAILVVLDEPQGALRYGGTVSAPVAQKVLTETLPYLGVEPEYTDEERAHLNLSVPKVVDKSVSVASNTLTNAGLKKYVVGSGSMVVKQVPEAGKAIPKGGMVVLYTDDTQDKMTKVPNFKGMTLSQANVAATNAHINLEMSGLDNGKGEAIAESQSIEKDQSVPQGTVVTVRFIYKDTIA